jgi:hypothetical protein
MRIGKNYIDLKICSAIIFALVGILNYQGLIEHPESTPVSILATLLGSVPISYLIFWVVGLILNKIFPEWWK